MITYFPQIYQDELVYSVLARIVSKSGYVSCIQATEEFFVNPKEHLEFLFVNNLKPEMVQIFTGVKSWERILVDHTMFPYYSRFLSAERKNAAFHKLQSMKGNYINVLSITPNRRDTISWLRYCPLCVEEHRKRYGETYWQRVHQIPEIAVCPVHGCRLQNSIVNMDRHKTREFCPAEISLDDMNVNHGDEIEQRLAKYAKVLLDADIQMETYSGASEFLISKMTGTKYLSTRGQIVNTGLLYQDLREYYSELVVGIQKQWQLSKILHGKRINPFEIAQIGLFLNVPAEQLVSSVLPEKAPEEYFDEQVVQMIQEGMSAYKIAEELNVSKSLVRLIASNNGVRNKKNIKYVTKQVGDRQQRVHEYRKVWLEAIEHYPDLCYTKLRDIPEYKSKLNWLRRNDKEWTDTHYPGKYNKRLK